MYFLRSTLFLFQMMLIESQVKAFMVQMQNMNVNLKDTIRTVKVELNHIIQLMQYLNSTFDDTISYREENIPQKITAASPVDETIRNPVDNVREVNVVIPLLANTSRLEQKESSLNGLLGIFQNLFKALDETPVLALNETSVTKKPDVIRKRNSSLSMEANYTIYTNYTDYTKVSKPRMTIRSRPETEINTTMEPWSRDNILWNLFNPKTSTSGTLKSNKTQTETLHTKNSTLLYSLSDYIPKKGLHSRFMTLPNKKTRTFLTDSLCLTEKCGVSMMRSKLHRPTRTRYTSPFNQYNPLHSIFLKNSLDLRNLTYNLTPLKKSTTLPPLEEDLHKFVMYYT